jgi:hypothetical protein
LVTETVKLDDGRLPDFSIPTGRSHPRHQVRINPNIYALLAEEKCLQAGVELRYYETPVKAEFTDGRWNIEVVGKGTRMTTRCKQLIDCTGNGYMTALAGYPVLREDVIQPGSLMFKIGEYDNRSVDKKLLREKYEEAVKDGRLVRKEFRNRIEGLLQSAGNNIHHISDADSTTSAAHTATNIESRTTLLETLRFLREEVPGCEKTKLCSPKRRFGKRTGSRGNMRLPSPITRAESCLTMRSAIRFTRSMFMMSTGCDRSIYPKASFPPFLSGHWCRKTARTCWLPVGA